MVYGPECVRCKGRWKMYDVRRPAMCRGKPCQMIQHIKKSIKNIPQDFFGSAPSIFVGRYNYPHVNVGVLASGEGAEKSWKADNPEYWYSSNLGFDRFLSLRYSLVNSYNAINVKSSNRFLEAVQQIAMSVKPTDTEISFTKKPFVNISLSNIAAPLGARGKTRGIRITENPSIPQKVDYIVNDDLLASDGVFRLYKHVPVHAVQKIFSSGLMGISNRIVPTRYSITAVDDILSKKLLRTVKDFNLVNDIMVFENQYLGNRFWVVLLPGIWSFEMFEKWGNYEWLSDYEPHEKRKGYADNIIGAYYAARLAACEYLLKTRRQASVLIIRKVRDYSSLGVWVIREAVRDALSKRPIKFQSMDELLNYIPNIKSKIILESKQQKRLSDFSNN